MDEPEVKDILGYAAPPPPREASARRVFWWLLPASLCVGCYIASVTVEKAYPQGDSRNFGGACLIVVMAPVGLVCGIFAVVEAMRPRGWRAFVLAGFWNLAVVIAPCVGIWVIHGLGLFRHF